MLHELFDLLGLPDARKFVSSRPGLSTLPTLNPDLVNRDKLLEKLSWELSGKSPTSRVPQFVMRDKVMDTVCSFVVIKETFYKLTELLNRVFIVNLKDQFKF
jgi:hypothetical protein